MAQKIERVDSIPIILAVLHRMGVQEIIDTVFVAHGNWSGLTYGQLAVLFVTYVLHSLTHRLYGMESWLSEHRTVIEQATGWQVGEKDATDDRLGILTEALGENSERAYQFQTEIGRRIVSAYELPTKVARYDTTSFNVFHHPENREKGLLEFGHSKNFRPDLLQFKQGLGVLDPAGVPILSETLGGNCADDPCYLPAWRRMVCTLGKPNFLYIADCKAASLETRATIDHEKGFYLFPMPMTGEIPRLLRELVLNPAQLRQEIELEPRDGQDEGGRVVGRGFVVTKQIEARLDSGALHKFQERWMVSCSDAHAQRQEKSFQNRLDKAATKLENLKPRKEDTVDSYRSRAEKIIETYRVEDYLGVEVKETIGKQKKYIGRGRPGAKSRFEMLEVRNLTLVIVRDESEIEKSRKLMGWRIFVTNVPSGSMTLNQSTQYYRDEWLVERGFHRFKSGNIPALPLYLRVPDRIKGLMLLLTIALQVLTLMEFVSRKELSNREGTISGLVPGNPKMRTNRPTAERMLSQFNNLHLLIEEKGGRISVRMVEALKPVQQQILSILQLPERIYDLSFRGRKKNQGVKK